MDEAGLEFDTAPLKQALAAGGSIVSGTLTLQGNYGDGHAGVIQATAFPGTPNGTFSLVQTGYNGNLSSRTKNPAFAKPSTRPARPPARST